VTDPQVSARPWLLYGANGFTGRLIASEAAARGERPILAGRREAQVREVAEPRGFEWRVFDLADERALRRGIEGAGAVLLAAGPFSETSRPVMRACLDVGAHYLDITGEIAVIEAAFARDQEARERGVVILPACGFDVVPSDCLAASLAEALPGATRLELAFAALGAGVSAGTAKSMIEGLAKGGAIREGGRIRRVPIAWRRKVVPYRDQPRLSVSAPWGDVATAWRSTGIPDIVVWMAAPPRLTRVAPLLRLGGRALRLGPVRRLAQRVAGSAIAGPDADARRTGRAQLWGRVEDVSGRSVEGWAETPEGYAFTAVAAVECVHRLLAGPRSGALTPSLAFGAGFLRELPECTLEVGPVREAA
jgi:saccharopine dehydrogenase (NAD+, L-lysine-forming)